ncbi:MAG: hypothetical protein JXK94_05020 [Deltaproteobacteria bacterium]|nr:hypothetical protein [Deltaproteobacteria bacterium]
MKKVVSMQLSEKIREIVMIDPAGALIIGLSVFCLVALFVTLFLVVRLRRSRKEVRLLLESSAKKLSPPLADRRPEAVEESNPFGDAIFEAETKKKLREGVPDRQVPDKYRYAPCLLKRGLKNEEIAEVLSLSSDEVDQIAKLTHIALQVNKATVH